MNSKDNNNNPIAFQAPGGFSPLVAFVTDATVGRTEHDEQHNALKEISTNLRNKNVLLTNVRVLNTDENQTPVGCTCLCNSEAELAVKDLEWAIYLQQYRLLSTEDMMLLLHEMHSANAEESTKRFKERFTNRATECPGFTELATLYLPANENVWLSKFFEVANQRGLQKEFAKVHFCSLMKLAFMFYFVAPQNSYEALSFNYLQTTPDVELWCQNLIDLFCSAEPEERHKLPQDLFRKKPTPFIARITMLASPEFFLRGTGKAHTGELMSFVLKLYYTDFERWLALSPNCWESEFARFKEEARVAEAIKWTPLKSASSQKQQEKEDERKEVFAADADDELRAQSQRSAPPSGKRGSGGPSSKGKHRRREVEETELPENLEEGEASRKL